MHEFHALLAEVFAVGEEPAGKHGREHAVGFRIAGFTPPDVEVLGVDCVNVSLRAAVEIIDIGCDGFAVFVHAADAADDAVTHDGGDVGRTVAFALDGLDGLLHALDGDVEKLIDVHLHPAGLRVVQSGGKRVRRDRIEVFVVDGNLNRLRAGIETHVKLCHVQLFLRIVSGHFSSKHCTQVF